MVHSLRFEPPCGVVEAFSECREAPFDEAPDTVIGLVDLLAAALDGVAYRHESLMGRDPLHVRLEPIAPGEDGLVQSPFQNRDALEETLLALHHNLRGGRRCRGASVGHEIRNGEICFVSNGAHDWDG